MRRGIDIDELLDTVEAGKKVNREQALALVNCEAKGHLSAVAQGLSLVGHGANVSFSKKVFIPLTQLCADVCHYCAFAHAPRRDEAAYLSREAVLDIARRGQEQGCKEALFTLGDRPERRYAAARNALADLGHASTLSYLEEIAGLVLKETGLLPHLNPGLTDEAWSRRLRSVSASQGLMLETTSHRLSQRGGPHFGSMDKAPAARLAAIEAAGRAGAPFTSGILIGIGETREERVDALLAIRDLHDCYGHIQEIIIQNFRAKPGTRMENAPEPTLEEQVWTIAVARILFGPTMNIQSPPNLRPESLGELIHAGINDWGGVSPVTPDHVNPEAPWPHLVALGQATEQAGRSLVERVAIYPDFALEPERWLSPQLQTPVLRMIDTSGFAREDGWAPGGLEPLPTPATTLLRSSKTNASRAINRIIRKVMDGSPPDEAEIVTMFEARGADFSTLCRAADHLRKLRVGDRVSYVVNRNINYTNICTYGCKFCAFSKGRHNIGHRDKPYDLALEEIAKRVEEASERGATEVCLQGGIRPGYTGDTYLAIVGAVKSASPHIHVHAFSPLEIWHGAETLGLSLRDYLVRQKAMGLASLPGTAAEILDDEVRAVLCPDKISTAEWFEVMEAAHSVGLKSTATIMFGHVDAYRHWARHLLRVRDLQARTGGFTEFVPLPFVHMEAPIYLKGRSRKGPTFREALLMHSVARLTLDPGITNIQASWVKMGPQGAALCLEAGANDLGGVLMNESITRAAGAEHGQELSADDLCSLISGAGREPYQRGTDYQETVYRGASSRRDGMVSEATHGKPPS
ncbi:7,8-didemethyl-8-hydroxy-5-deazariboflavin synthase [Mesorhizobium sp. WSM3879]|uniref:5-amino-6-(D-ribitylamino)uracil--L-tyrosine 4-hydroxyphenyl transferase CofH n=1 Tax=Mesorhizobium sp. WSM3879 TaxID=2029406 RepID=UPI000BAED202|nr:5-amino-6-(D-ribitylamino)uracil--L-tyrosine 4-hydroxyphenyl transferase CofH [Mesorhizobium sp. WSM3879]PBB81256.1 7,8-didemethyl-8-hydroxy-5-deazariboflavin synthase [Mesorhizobium sp. WSM3879]